MLEKAADVLHKFFKYPLLRPYWDERELKTILGCISSNSLSQGQSTGVFSSRMKKRFGYSSAVATNSGRTAILLALNSIPKEKGRSEVILPSYGCVGTIQPILQAGFTPVFCDVGEDYNISASSISAACSKKTRAVIVPSLFGKPAEWKGIKKISGELGLFAIDDAAQSFGAEYSGVPVGSFGDA
ncbi:MAG: DegT/DnrJ/EryC1/StrS family aminotransferase, partial [Candidatus Micrarchaeota archaeon]